MNPRFSERSSRHYQGKPHPGEEGEEKFEDRSFVKDAWRDYKKECGKNWENKEEE